MPELKLSTIWEVKDFLARSVNGCILESGHLAELEHASLPGVKWLAHLYADGQLSAKGEMRFVLFAFLGRADSDANYVFPDYAASVLDADGREVVTYFRSFCDFTPTSGGRASSIAFQKEKLENAVRKSGSICVRIDVVVWDVGAILNFHKSTRGVVHFKVGVEGETFRLHKTVLAEASPFFAALFEQQMQDAESGVIHLADVKPSAFKAFCDAIVYGNLEFLCEADLTQDVLALSERFKVCDLKRECDAALAMKVNQSNALEILTTSAAFCNAEKTKSVCIAILVRDSEFKKSQSWLDFKKSNSEAAMDILDTIGDELFRANENLIRDIGWASDEIERQSKENKVLDEFQKLAEMLRKEQDGKLKEVSAAESRLRTENARLEGNCVGLCERVGELQQQNAQANLELADLKFLRKKQDDKLEEASAVESRLRAENARLEKKHAGLIERVVELQQQNAEGNLEVAGLQTILGLRDDALNQAVVVEAQLRTDIAQLEESRVDLTELVSELQQNAEESGERARLKEECAVCMEQYSAARPKEVLYRCGHCFCSVCIDRVKNEARSRRIGNGPVEFNCPICKAEFYDVVRLFNN